MIRREKMSTGIQLENIQVGQRAENWMEAIKIAAQPLIKGVQ